MTNVSRCCHCIVAFVVPLIALSIAAPTPTIHAQDPTATDVPTSTPAPTDTWTPTPTPTNTPTATDAPTATDTPTGAPSPTETATLAEITPEVTETVAPSETETATPTDTETATETPTATPTLPPEPPLELAYSDGFEDGDLGAWILGTGWTYAANDTGTGLQAVNTADMAYFLLYPLLDVVVEARVRLDTGALRMHLRLNDSGTAYEVWLDANGQVALLRNGQVIAVSTAPQSIPGAWHSLRGSVIGDTIRIAIDGVEIIALQDPDPLPAGAVAFSGIGTGTIQLDDFRLWRPVEEVAQQSALESGPVVSTTETEYMVGDTQTLINKLEEVNAQNSSGYCLDPTPKTIILTASEYTLYEANNSSVRGPNGLPLIICNVTIETENGSETNRATIQRSSVGGTPLFRLFEVGDYGSLSLDYVVIHNGNVSDVGGGGILNEGGTLTIRNSLFTGNSASGPGGGGVFIPGTVGRSITIQNSEFLDNHAIGGFGGGVNLGSNSVDEGGTITGSSFRNNSALYGGGIAATYGGTTALSITNTIAEGNSSTGSGGGAWLRGNINLQNVTISNNQANGQGGGIYNESAFNGVNDLQVMNSIIANNTATLSGGAITTSNPNGANNVTINNSCITNNTDTSAEKYIISADTITFNASGNWWGAVNGPSGAGPGSGDSVGPNVIYQPFLTAPPTVGMPAVPCEYNVPSRANLQVGFDPNFFPERTMGECETNYADPGHCWVHISVLSLISTLNANSKPFNHQMLMEALIESEYRPFSDKQGLPNWGNEAVARQFYGACRNDGCQGEELYSFLDYFQAPRNDTLDDEYREVLRIREKAQQAGFEGFQDYVQQLLDEVSAVLTPADPAWLNGVVNGRPYGFGTRGIGVPVNVSDSEVTRYAQLCGFAVSVRSDKGNPPLGQMFIGTKPETDGGVCSFRN